MKPTSSRASHLRHLVGSTLGFIGLVTLFTCKPQHHFDAMLSAQVTINSFTRPNTLNFDNFASLDITRAVEVKEQGIARKQLKSAKLHALTVRVATPASGQDLAFLDSLRVFAHRDGQTDVLVAHGENFPDGMILAGLDIEDVELQGYFNTSAGLTLVTQATYSSGPADQTTLLANPIFTVETTPAQSFCNNR